jgi:F0F1-type ATP synthase delta subunit
MSANPLASRIASPYARALFDFSVEKHNASNYSRLSEFRNFLDETSELTNYLNNPVVNQNAKREVLSKTLESQVNAETLNFNDFSQKKTESMY